MYALAESISDLLEQPIRGNSVNAMLHCPFHEDRTPSFSIHLDDGVWHCFSCEESGTLNSLYKRLGKDIDLNVRFYQAKQRTEAPTFRQTNFAALANQCLRDVRRKDGEGHVHLRDFLASRGIATSTSDIFGLGFNIERGAISFPYIDSERRVTGIKYRYRDGFKASESGSHYGLYGLTEVVGKDRVIICEGESDTLATHSIYADHGYGVGGTSGASVSEAQWSRFAINLLFASRVYLLYDADEAGDRCAETAMRVLGDDKCIRLRPTRGKDASEHYANGGDLTELGLIS